jgi:PPOX class probable F420-dependent enzyme
MLRTCSASEPARRVPDVAELERPPDRPRRAAADPDLRLRRGMRLGGRVLVRPVAALEQALAAPERAHEPDRLVGAPAASLEVDAHEVVLIPVPVHPDAEREAAARELLERRHLLRKVERVVQRHEHNRGAEAHAFRPAGDPAERDERVVETAVRVDARGADNDVLGRPDGVEAELLCGLRDAPDPLRRRIALKVGQDHPEVHDARLTAARVARLATLDPDGRPHLVPIMFAFDGDTLCSAVDRKPKRSRRLRRIENARARADVTILVDHYEEDWGRLWWIRLRGRARVLDAGEELKRALALLREKYPQYTSRPAGLSSVGPEPSRNSTRWRAALKARPRSRADGRGSDLGCSGFGEAERGAVEQPAGPRA